MIATGKNRPAQAQGQQEWDEKPDVLEQTLGDRLKKSLRVSGLSVGDMAEALEIHRNTISAWLADRARPQPVTLRFWAEHNGVPIEWLRDGKWPEAAPAPAPVKKAAARKAPPAKAVARTARTAGKPARAAAKKR